MKRIFRAETKQDLERCYPIMKELRTNLEYRDFVEIYNQAHESDGYEIIAVEKDSKVVAVMGYRWLSDYVRGRHLYIDDLVTSEAVRSKGLGAELLKYAENIASLNKCKALRLCTGIENQDGVRFYERNGWTKRAFAFTKRITTS